MRPLDPRLLTHASAARWFLLVGAVLGLAQTLTVVAFAWLLSQSITLAVDGGSFESLRTTVAALAAVVVVRAVLVWLLEVAANRGAAAVKSQLRAAVLARLAERGPDWLAGQQGARVATVITSGLDALDNYFARYLPQLLLTAIATPILVLVMLWQDPASGITVIIVLPFIPIFMILIGQATQAVQRQQWDALQRLSSGFLDVVGGLATLKIFGRDRRQAARLAELTDEYRGRTMTVLRVSFLSGFVLELAGSLSVALIAVSIGLRLVEGSLLLGVGLFVLLLAPEAFLPLRQVGAQFHAAADGLAAAEEVFTILDDEQPNRPVPAASAGGAPSARTAPPARLRFDSVTIRRGETTPIDGFSQDFAAGRLTVLSGPSGVGKSTLIGALQGFVPFDGTLFLGTDAVAVDDDRGWLAWAGQRPGLFSGSVSGNVALGASVIDEALVTTALHWAGAGDLDPAHRLGVNGAGLSGGQSQRVAAARAIYRCLAVDCPVLVLDEPSSALDEDAEAALIGGLRRLTDQGRIVIVVSHRPAFVAAADAVVRLNEVAHV
ncbi:thiol reductant ABC exporter subunit CydD [Cryobacterium adonitolivorans]|uniref:Thiol reductant ABC exporter subunit CydD n=1 Tax=Cryobacterium adonitolivorans TaxID=1259189 RepID=A0A4R8VZ39_9MICO|nr:thiol reductant ABC exporter subunit CydD [Cryobacterium adonitolivorans]TFB98217.1 thiol reductant ABC exporter subunit CydD [Cryobacterium adonitolivorans]